MPGGKLKLFDGDSDEDKVNLTVNEDYAKRYERWREAETKQKLEDKYGKNADVSSSSSSSSDDDDDPEVLNQVWSKDFFETIASLKRKDPKIYNPNVEFFKDEKARGDFDPRKGTDKKKKEKDKPLYLRDYERKIILERGGELSDDDSDLEKHKLEDPRSQSPTYVEEQRQLKESLKKALHDDDDDDDEDTGLLKKKIKTKEEKVKEENDYIEWLRGEKEALADKEAEESLKPLQKAWNDPKLDEEEKFLRDYVLNKRYLENNGITEDDDNLSDDDEEMSRSADFERKYNFRFEEPDQEYLKRYPRTLDHSIRQKDTRRKERRDAVKRRKEEEKKRKIEELKVLKALKRKEILQKIEKIKAITGNDNLGMNPEELEEDFDPEAHDRRMKELFNDDYYEECEDAEDESELNLPPLEEELIDDNMNWDDYDGTDKILEDAEEGAARNEDHQDNGDGPHCEDPDFNMDCDYDPAAESLRREQKSAGRISSREKRKLKRQSRFGRLIRKEKPVFNPEDKTFQEYVDEYYGIDCEDFIGDLPCRFKYKKVIPNSFGLTIEEILAADDKELNQWASIKKAYTIRSDEVERYEAKVYQQKAQNEALKRKILPSLYRHENEKNDYEEERASKKKKKKAKNHCEELLSFNHDLVTDESSDVTGKKKKKKKKNKTNSLSEEAVNSNHCNSVDESCEVRKKKKKQTNSHSEEAVSVNDCNIIEETSDLVAKKKKKKKEKETNEVETDPCFNEEVNTSSVSNIAVKKEKKKKKRKYSEANPADSENQDKGINNQPTKKARKSFDEGDDHKKSKKKGNQSWNGDKKFEKRWKGGQKSDPQTDLSDARLKAYGINPKKYKNKLKYGAQS